MSTALVTLILIIHSPGMVSSRQQAMTLSECNAEMSYARATLRASEQVVGGCILRPETSKKVSK